jgi:hypothetical protein
MALERRHLSFGSRVSVARKSKAHHFSALSKSATDSIEPSRDCHDCLRNRFVARVFICQCPLIDAEPAIKDDQEITS